MINIFKKNVSKCMVITGIISENSVKNVYNAYKISSDNLLHAVNLATFARFLFSRNFAYICEVS